MPFTDRTIRGLSATAAFLILADSSPASANEGGLSTGRDILAWGVTTSASVQLVPAEDHPADILFVNRLTHGNPLEMAFALEIDSMIVEVEVSNGVGEQPDLLFVTPPMGFVAVPSSIEVHEGETGRIAIMHALLS
jgi:hypothetical protein